MGDSDEIITARRALGRHLAHLRKTADLTQHGLAPLVRYARSSIASTETGLQYPDRMFWRRCDTALRTGGALVAEYDRIAELDLHRQRSQLDAGDTAATGGEALWEPEQHIAARRAALTAANEDARLTHLEDEIRQAITDNERLPPATLVGRLRPLRVGVDELMAARHHPPQRARLYTVAAHLSGLLAVLALDLRAFGVARAYAAEAFELADAAEQPDVRAWARATQSLIAYYSGDPRDALNYADDGLRHSGTSAHRIRLLVNGQARALACVGDRYGVDRAVDHAFALLAGQPAAEQVSTSLTLGPYCLARAAANAATAYLTIGRTAEVIDHLATPIAAFDAAQLRGPQALSRLDLATAHLHAGNLDHAADLAVEALTLAADCRFESVRQRARQFLGAARPFGRHPQLLYVTDLLNEYTPTSSAPRSGLRSPA
ncbi:helix-turn-helix transcriptional regulator [Micromonospora sp. NPDC050980]|uniref:helix-turn-helix transcriptional regulator n=1 Tax=Micromonospora sp. NPDC050980 TaxID=3155161 RepID=UPI0033DB48A7